MGSVRGFSVSGFTHLGAIYSCDVNLLFKLPLVAEVYRLRISSQTFELGMHIFQSLNPRDHFILYCL